MDRTLCVQRVVSVWLKETGHCSETLSGSVLCMMALIIPRLTLSSLKSVFMPKYWIIIHVLASSISSREGMFFLLQYQKGRTTSLWHFRQVPHSPLLRTYTQPMPLFLYGNYLYVYERINLLRFCSCHHLKHWNLWAPCRYYFNMYVGSLKEHWNQWASLLFQHVRVKELKGTDWN